MPLTSPTVPLIAITTEDTDDEHDQYDDNVDIGDVATDIEEIDFDNEKKKKKQKPKKQVSELIMTANTTDDEEIEGTGDELEPYIIKHENPVSIQDVIDLEEPPTYEETFKVEGKGPKNRKKLKTQTSTTSSNMLEADTLDVNQSLTDIEDFHDSDDSEEISEKEDVSNLDLLTAVTQDLGSTNITDSVKKYINETPSPLATPVDGPSDNENEKINFSKKLKIPLKKTNLLSSASLSPEFSDLTDTEILRSDDSNDECSEEQKSKHLRTKNRKHRNTRGATTDTEELYVSDDESKLFGQVSVSKVPNFHIRKAKKLPTKYLGKNRSESEPSILIIRSSNESDKKGKRKSQKKSNVNTLNVEMLEIEGFTDIEDFETGESAAEEDLLEDNDNNLDPNVTAELDSYYGTTEEKSSTKNYQKLYKTESFLSKKISDKCESENNESQIETDEEAYEQDTTTDEKEEIEISEDICTIKFIPYKKTKPLKTRAKKSESKILLTINNEEEPFLTDTEYLNSSDEEKEGTNQIAAIVLNNELKEYDTGTESVDEIDMEYSTIKDIPPEYIPKVVREQIIVKETPDDNVITVIPLSDNENTLNIEEKQVDPHTDVEDISGDEEIHPNDEYVDDEVASPYMNMAEEGTTESTEILKSPIKDHESEVETDYEEISPENKVKTKKNTYLKEFLETKQNSYAKLTDTEDFELSDGEKFDKNLMVREVHNRSLTPGIRTEIEDIHSSGDDLDENMPVTPDPSISSLILQEMSETTISSKEGSGPFSKQERKKLYKKNRPVHITPSSPMQTDTDEMFTSADDESHSYSRAETATPAQMRQDLDDASNLKVTTQHTKKIDTDAADEVMYIKGGGFTSDQYTDISDVGLSDDEYYNADDKNIDDKVCLCIVGSENGENFNVSIREEKEWGSAQEPSALVDHAEEPSPAVQDATQQEQQSGTWQETTTVTRTVTGTTAAQAMRAEERDEGHTTSSQETTEQRSIADQHQLSDEMKELLEEMEKHAKK